MILPIVGLDPMMIAVAGVLSTLWGIFGHTQVINKLGLLEWVFNTPSHHRVHHGSNIQYIDKNYGNLLIIWDRLFGTFEPEIETVKYGLVKNVNTFNPVKITFMGWQEIFSDIKDSNSDLSLTFILKNQLAPSGSVFTLTGSSTIDLFPSVTSPEIGE